MNATTAAVTLAKATIDRLLSNGKASATSGLIKGEQCDTWTYAEPFSGLEVSVNYWHCDNGWTYRVTNNASDSTFFSKAGRARTLKEARLDALDAMVAGCAQAEKSQPLEIDSDGNLLNGHLREKAAKVLGIMDNVAYKVVSGNENNAGYAAQAEKKDGSIKKELLKLMQNEDHQQAVKDVINSGLMPQQLLRRWIDTAEWRAIQRGEGQDVSPEWRQWAYWRLTGKIKTAEKGDQWQKEFLWRTVEPAGRAAWNSTESLSCSERADAWMAAEVAEREQQYNDLLAIINEM